MASLGLSEEERATIERFEAEVVAPSMSALVILDFWAEWCGPCKQLGPVLEKIAADYADRGVKLVKIDVDQEKTLAAQFRIQSIPTVYAIYQGQPVADLTNYRTEGQLTKVIDSLLGQLKIQAPGALPAEEIDSLVAMGEEVLGEGDGNRAVSIFRQVHELAPDNPAVVGGLVRALIATGATEEARAILDSVPEKLANKTEVARARAALDIASTAAVADTSGLEAKVAADPSDHAAALDLAEARMAAGDRDSAAALLLGIVGADRDWNEGAARKRFLQLLEAQGLEDPWSGTQRRKLSALLFT